MIDYWETRISLAGIARATGVSSLRLQDYVNQKYDAVPRKIIVIEKPKGKIRIQCDEMWSFVFSKNNKYWIWLAIDEGTREIVGVFIGKRDKEGASGLWNRSHQFIDNGTEAIQIFGPLTMPFFPKNAINRLKKGPGKPITLNGLMAQ